MTKYVKWLSFLICTLFVFSLNVEAARNNCPASVKKELSQSAAHIKVNYEIIDNSMNKEITVGDKTTTYKVPNYAFAITLYNLTSDFYARIETNSDSDDISVPYEETRNGNYTLYDYNIGDIYNYNITIYSTHPDCSGTVFRTLKFTKPRYNAFSEYTYCKNSTTYYCQRFITSDLKISTTDEFLDKISVNNEKNNPNKDKNDITKEIVDSFKSNWKLYLGIFFGLAILIVGGIFILKKYREKKGWKL